MPDQPGDFNPARYTPIPGSSRQYRDTETGEILSRRRVDVLRRTANVIKHRDAGFKRAVRRGVKESKERAEELRRLARELDDLATLIEERAANLGYDDYKPGDIGYTEYTPVELKKLAAAEKANVRLFQKIGKPRTKRITRTRKNVRAKIKKLHNQYKESDRPLDADYYTRVREMLEAAGLRDGVPHWVPPGFSDPKMRPKWWRASTLPKKYRMN